MTKKAVPDGYVDGCTLGPQRFGKVSHADICNQHDIDWWNCRTVLAAFDANCAWSFRIVRRHAGNGLWVLPAMVYAGLGFVFLNTVGWFWWRRK